jgi:hypothetical protein
VIPSVVYKFGGQSSTDAQTARTIQSYCVRGRIFAMLAWEECGWTKQLLSVQHEEVNIHLCWGAAKEFLAGIRANPKSANEMACA